MGSVRGSTRGVVRAFGMNPRCAEFEAFTFGTECFIVMRPPPREPVLKRRTAEAGARRSCAPSGATTCNSSAATVWRSTRYQVAKNLQWFTRIDNVFTGPSQGFDAANPRAEQFRGNGTPRGAWAGVQYTLE